MKSKNKTWTKKAKSETTDSKKELAAFIAKQVKAELNAFSGKDKKPVDLGYKFFANCCVIVLPPPEDWSCNKIDLTKTRSKLR